MLDLTDNIVGNRIVAPPQVVRRDPTTPISSLPPTRARYVLGHRERHLAGVRVLLGDAFASGGSAGYDHKKMGITARGAWECVKRHFRELGLNIQSEAFTAIGIGDMSGDVFAMPC